MFILIKNPATQAHYDTRLFFKIFYLMHYIDIADCPIISLPDSNQSMKL